MLKIIFLMIFFVTTAQAQKITLLLRSDISSGFNAPADSQLLDSTPVSSPRGDVAISMPFTQSVFKPAIWIKKYNEKRGKLKWTGLESEKVSSLGISKTGDVCFAHYNKNFFLKSLVYIHNNGAVFTINELPKSWAFASALPKNSNQSCFFLVMNLDGSRHIVSANFLDSELSSVYTPSAQTSYLFSPTSNFKDDLFFKIRIGDKGQISDEQPDQLIKWSQKNESILLSDKDHDKSAPVYDFSHLVSSNSSQTLSFFAEGYQKLILFRPPSQLVEIPLPNGQIELFTPQINDAEDIAIRHKSNNLNTLSVWKSNLGSWQQLLIEDQIISGDIGPLKISPSLGPALAGAVSISDNTAYIQVRFKDYKSNPAGQGLLQIQF